MSFVLTAVLIPFLFHSCILLMLLTCVPAINDVCQLCRFSVTPGGNTDGDAAILYCRDDTEMTPGEPEVTLATPRGPPQRPGSELISCAELTRINTAGNQGG